jgi:ATP-dependent RNA helicase DDX51/DBP6
MLGYSLPASLSESMVECTAEQKPLVLLAVLLEQGLLDKENDIHDGIVVVFTSSKDSTHRLARLVQLLWSAADYGPSTSVAEFSSALNQKQRAELMKRCNSNVGNDKVQVIVCSDGMSRGMDIQSVSAVINYDVPSFAKTYVHRCGRTARAGRKGRAITMLKGGQVTKFLKMRQLIDSPDRVTKIGIKKDLVKTAIPVYQKCIKALQNVMDAELNENLSPVESLGSEWF